MKNLSFRASKGAALLEYAVLVGLIGAVAVGAVAQLSGAAIRGTDATTVALQTEVLDRAPGESGGPSDPGTTPETPSPFAVCDPLGPFPADTLRGGGVLTGGEGRQTFLALPGASVDGGEDGEDFDVLFVAGPNSPGAAFVEYDPENPENGRVSFLFGEPSVAFLNVEQVVVCADEV